MTTIVTRQGKGSPLSWVEADANFTNLNTDKAENSVVALKAPLASPNLTGVPTAPTATNGTNTTQLATTAFVQAKTATQTPSTATGNISATNVQSALAELDTEKAALSGATFSGQVTATTLQTGVSGTNTNNFRLDASAANGTMKLARGDGQDIMTVDAAGKVAFPQNLNTPVFSGSNAGSGVISSNVVTKLALLTIAIDTASWWNAGNTRYIPQVAGYYEVTVSVAGISSTASLQLATATLLKNGASLGVEGSLVFGYALANVSDARSSLTFIVAMNGTTDYIEPAARVVGGGTLSVSNFWMQIKLVRAGL